MVRDVLFPSDWPCRMSMINLGLVIAVVVLSLFVGVFVTRKLGRV